jgi:hypothetical protein
MFKHDFAFKHPTTVQIAGPTQAGKTQFVIKLLKNQKTLISPPPDRIIWSYGIKNERQMNEIKMVAPNVEFIEGIPAFDDIDSSINNLCVIDDQMDEIGKNQKCANLFTRGSHHDNMTVIAIIHNLFNQQKYSRTMGINSQDFVVFNSPRDKQQIEHFGRQIFPHNKHFIPGALQQATKKPFGYIIIDLHARTPDSLRVRTGIFPEEVPIIYVPTN